MNWLCECIDPQQATTLKFSKSGDILHFLVATQWNCKCNSQEHVFLKASENTISSANDPLRTLFFVHILLLTFKFILFHLFSILFLDSKVIRTSTQKLFESDVALILLIHILVGIIHLFFTRYEQVNVCLDLYNMTENKIQLLQTTWNKPLTLWQHFLTFIAQLLRALMTIMSSWIYY